VAAHWVAGPATKADKYPSSATSVIAKLSIKLAVRRGTMAKVVLSIWYCCCLRPAMIMGDRRHPHRDHLPGQRAERRFWRCVEDGERPRLFGVEPPKPRIQAVRIVDMSGSNAWAAFAGVFALTRAAYLEHTQAAKTELKSLMPEDAKEAIGHGVRAKRSKSGAVSFRPPRPGGQPCIGRVNPLPA
jgi:hypothetical protein